MNINKAFSFIFDDPQWVGKMAIGALVAMVPILNFAWMGYLVEIIRRAMRSDAEPLPDWNDFGKLFQDGLMLFVAGLVYALPMILLVCLPLGFITMSAVVSNGSGRMEDVANALATAGGMLFLGLMCLFILYGLALSVIYPVVHIFYAREGTLSACFKLGDALSVISKNSGPFFTAWLIAIGLNFGASFIAGAVGGLIGWIPCIGWIASLVVSLGAAVIATSIASHLFGQFGALVYRQSPTSVAAS